MAESPAYTYHPRWLRRRVSTYWWLEKWSYFAFVLREGSCLFVAWFVEMLIQFYGMINSDAPPRSVGWLGEAGALTFIAAWLWALITSLSLLREARRNEAAEFEQNDP